MGSRLLRLAGILSRNIFFTLIESNLYQNIEE
jgi:hypothetical protein